MAPRQFIESKPVGLTCHGHIGPHNDFIGRECCRVQVHKKISGRNLAKALGALHVDLAIHGAKATRPFRRRVPISNRSAPGA